MKKTIAALSALAIATSGCLSTGSKHYSPDGKLLDKSSSTAFMIRGEAAKVSSLTKDGAYERRLNVGSVKGETETDKVTALTEAIVAGAVQGAAKSVKP